MEDAFLDEINADLPAGVDWKQGAVTYLRELASDGGPETERYHLIKPFMAGPDLEMFWTEAFEFLDVVQKLQLPARARILDVGCGPGWTIQWLGRLGHEVIGLDISQELLDIAQMRMENDPFPPHVGEPWRYELRTHDIEAEPLRLDAPVDVALFASTLHHFFNPVAALRNSLVDLAEDGIVAVIEAAAPDAGTQWYEQNLDLMTRYHTIERPYTRPQLYRMLELAGLPYVEFYRPVNGLFRQDAESVGQVSWEIARGQNINVFLAARSREALARVEPMAQSVTEQTTGFRYLEGFYGGEAMPDGRPFRWAGARSIIRAGSGTSRLSIGCPLVPAGDRQTVRAIVDGKVVSSVTLPQGKGGEIREVDLALDVAPDTVVELHSDRVFSPSWSGGDDARLLAFTLYGATA